MSGFRWNVLWLISLFVFISFGAPQQVAAKQNSWQMTADQLSDLLPTLPDGATVIVDGGIHYGFLSIDRPVTLIGKNSPILDGQNKGSIVEITAEDVTIDGFIIRHSGASLDEENAGIGVLAARAHIINNQFIDTLFGIYLREAHNSVVKANTITGMAIDVPRRGDGIRVWSSHDTLVQDNVVNLSRDVVLWYSERLTIIGNRIENGRYGLHFMYCDDALIENNQLVDNSVGAFLMYSRRLTMKSNTIAGNRGPSGYAIGLKDVDDAVINDNLFLDNRIGVHLDGSPREMDSIGQFNNNIFGYNDIGLQMLPSVRNNHFWQNSFVDNGEQIAIAGGGRLGDNVWQRDGQGNFWSDYAGYDVDGDGVGDLPYYSQRLFENLMQEQPNIRLWQYSPVVQALDFSAKAFPIIRPQLKMSDTHPLMAPSETFSAPILQVKQDFRGTYVVVLLCTVALSLIWFGRQEKYQYKGLKRSLDAQQVKK